VSSAKRVKRSCDEFVTPKANQHSPAQTRDEGSSIRGFELCKNEINEPEEEEIPDWCEKVNIPRTTRHTQSQSNTSNSSSLGVLE